MLVKEKREWRTNSSNDGNKRRRWRRLRRRASARWAGSRSSVRRCLRHRSTLPASALADSMHICTRRPPSVAIVGDRANREWITREEKCEEKGEPFVRSKPSFFNYLPIFYVIYLYIYIFNINI